MEPSPCCRCRAQGWLCLLRWWAMYIKDWLGLTSLATFVACAACMTQVVLNQLPPDSLHRINSSIHNIISCDGIPSCITSYHNSQDIAYYICIVYIYIIGSCISLIFYWILCVCVPVCPYLFCPWLLFHIRKLIQDVSMSIPFTQGGARFTNVTLTHIRSRRRKCWRTLLQILAMLEAKWKADWRTGHRHIGLVVCWWKKISLGFGGCLFITVNVFFCVCFFNGSCNMFQCVVSRWKP